MALTFDAGRDSGYRQVYCKERGSTNAARLAPTYLEFNGGFKILQSGTGATITGAIAATSPVLTTPKVTGLMQLGGTTDSAALTLGGGSSGTNLTTASANKNFVSFYTTSTATSGDSRLAYLLHTISGNGGDGECVRARTKLSGTGHIGVNGSHTTLEYTTAGTTVTGLGTVQRLTLDFGANTAVQGTVYGQLIESISTAARGAITRCAFQGFRSVVATGGTGPRHTWAFGDTEGPYTTGTGDTAQLKTGGTFTVAGGVAILVNGVEQYVPYGGIST